MPDYDAKLLIFQFVVIIDYIDYSKENYILMPHLLNF